MSAEFQWPLRVYIEDTDAGGIVYYVNYLKYMERARTEFMRSHGFCKNSFGKSGFDTNDLDKNNVNNNGVFTEDLMFVVHAVAVRYRKPARLDDELIATARVVEMGAAQLTFEQRILRGAEELCGGTVRIACVERATLKPRRLPHTMVSALAVHS